MTTARAWWRGGLLAAGLLAALAPAGRAQTELAWKFQKDQSFAYEFSQTSNATIQVSGQEIKTKNVLTIGLTWKVGEVADDGTATITQTVDYVVANIEGGPQKIAFDSREGKAEGEAAQALKEVYDEAIGKPYTLTVTKLGEITDVQVPEGVTAKLQNSPFAALADGGSIFSTAGLKNLLAQVMPRLPAEPKKPGETWPAALELPAGPLKMNLKTTYTLGEPKENVAPIEAAVDTTITATENAPIKVEVKEQAGKATFQFDTAAGRLATSELTQKFVMALDAAGQTIQQTIELTAGLKSR